MSSCAVALVIYTKSCFFYSTANWHNTDTIPRRIIFKIALMVFDCSRGRCPKYFSDVYIPVHTVAARSHLRSADHGDLVVPCVLYRFGCRSFRVSGPTIWNDLSLDFRSSDITREQFKRRAGYLSVLTAEGASEKQSSLKARLRNGLTYLLTIAPLLPAYEALQMCLLMLLVTLSFSYPVSFVELL